MDAQRSSEFPTCSEKASGILRPVTSHGTGRYETSTLIQPLPRQIPSGLFTTSKDPEPEYLPPRWSAHVHPEGQLYFHHDGPLRVVTEAYLYRPEIVETLSRWIDRIQEILSSTKPGLSRDVELFIKLEAHDCAYYFVDHATRTQFWLEPTSTDELGLPPVVSISQLKIVLEELYWIHVEHFPMHLDALPSQTLEELIGIFSHGLCDQMTSRVSTFLYTAQDCKAFVTILQGCRGNMAISHTTWIIARLWSVIDHNKYITHHGQEHSRLSRDQAILYDPEQKHRWISTIMAALTFRTSDKHLARLDDVFVDHIVYVDQWERLMSDCLREWRRSACGALYGLMLHLPFLVLNTPSPVLLALSAAVFGSGLASSIILTHKYDPMQNSTATDAMYYLETVQSPIFKFQPLAFVFSLPKALNLWGFEVSLVNCALVIAQYFGLAACIGFIGLSLLLVLALFCTTSEGFLNSLAKLTAPRREEADGSMV